MSLINDPTNSRSLFPINVDNLTLYTNGVGINSTINAEIWNTIETALYRLQIHGQKTPLFFDSADRHRVCISGTVTVSSTGTLTKQATLINFTAGQLAFLNGGVTRSGSLIVADVIGLTTTDDCTADVALGAGSVSVVFRRTDPTQFLSAGSYLIMVTIMGY